ncbi:MAG: acyl-CoA dehydrogenase family protein [Candidatus Poriferisodalaceae bacterium]
MPDFLTEAQSKLQQQADTLAKQLSEIEFSASNSQQIQLQTTQLSKDAGVFALTQPVEYGGLGATTLELTIARDALGGRNVGHLPGIFGPSPGLLAQATEEIKQQFLEPYLAGETTSGFGFTEPADAERHTWAQLDGDELVVNGAKSYVTGGSNAHFINTLVELDHVGPTMILIETNRPGVELERSFSSLDGSHHASFTFTNVRVPKSHAIGATGAGMTRALEQVNAVRMAIAADCVGLCSFVCALVASHIQSTNNSSNKNHATRVQFGRMRTKAFGARSSVYRTARLIDAGQNSVNEVMASKILASETIAELVDTAIQVIGGEALIESHPLASIFRRIRASRLAEGPTDVLHANISRGYLDLNLGRI